MKATITAILVAVMSCCVVAQANGRAATAFKLTDTNGQAHELKLDDDATYVLEWTNKDCPYVVRHYKTEKTMQMLSEKYAKDVTWLTIDSTNTAKTDKVEAWRKEFGVSAPVLMDTDGTVARAYGAKTTPHMFIVKQGKIVYEGAIDDYKQGEKATVNYVSQALDEIMAGKAVSVAKTNPYGCSVKLAAEKKGTKKIVKAEWMDNYEAALKLAAETKRPIIADFTGSDWCIWCKKLKAEVFDTPEFEKWAEQNVILLELDFPRGKQVSDEVKKQNNMLKDKFGIKGFPTVVFMDAKGNEVARSGYLEGGPKPWITDAEKKLD